MTRLMWENGISMRPNNDSGSDFSDAQLHAVGGNGCRTLMVEQGQWHLVLFFQSIEILYWLTTGHLKMSIENMKGNVDDEWNFNEIKY